jgi:predicted Zn-dependent protease
VKVCLGLLVLGRLILSAAQAQPLPAPGPLLQPMQQEMKRSMATLAKEPVPPYFLSYEITEAHRIWISGSFGTLTGSEESRTRQLDIDLRVGSHELDNSRQIRGAFDFSGRFSHTPIPVEDDPEAVRAILWYHTDAKYKRAVERLTRVRANVQVKVEQEDQSADFSLEKPVEYLGQMTAIALDRPAWEKKIRKYTAPFAEHGNIFQAEARVRATAETRWYVSSEGTRIQSSRPGYRLFISALTKADDGMELPRYESFYASSADGLPDDETVLAIVDDMIEDLLALREAPVVEPYTGPAILSGRASGVFFHEVFGHRIEGHRQKDEGEGQTFKKKVGQPVLPETFSVYFDPTLTSYAGEELAGHYRYDNQGVKARRVPVVEDGVFKSFLMSRSPIEGFSHSNGHGRKQAGFAAVARQSNLLVEVKDTVSRDQLKQQLIELVRQEEKPFGLRFEDIQGGFTITGRTIPNAFNVLPILVYRVYPDGREELVRGVDLIGTPLTAFSKVLAGDDRIAVFNGVCGAESGGVPVAAASPGLLLSQIEVQKKEKSQERAPILPAPFDEESE